MLTGHIFGKPKIGASRSRIRKLREVDKLKVNIEDAKELTSLAEYAYSLSFEEEPNYSKIRFLMTKVLLEKDVVPSNDFDWNKSETISTKVHELY